MANNSENPELSQVYDHPNFNYMDLLWQLTDPILDLEKGSDVVSSDPVFMETTGPILAAQMSLEASAFGNIEPEDHLLRSDDFQTLDSTIPIDAPSAEPSIIGSTQPIPRMLEMVTPGARMLIAESAPHLEKLSAKRLGRHVEPVLIFRIRHNRQPVIRGNNLFGRKGTKKCHKCRKWKIRITNHRLRHSDI
jgi:hypothetical protein